MDVAAAGAAARPGLIATGPSAGTAVRRRAGRAWRLEPELHLGEQTVVPDLAGWRLERMPRLPETAYFALAPDWVCEVLSPSTVQLDRAKKLRIYAEYGVRHAWLADPLARTLEVLRLEGGHWRLVGTHAGTVTVHAEPFGAIELELGALWEA